MPEVVDALAIPSNLVDFSYEKILANQNAVDECHSLAQKYLKKYSTPEKAAKHLISAIAKQCGAFGAYTVGYAALHKFQKGDLPKVTVKEIEQK